jgi:methylmalonyl-CoA mutase cobalamin-binding domain/chain
MKTNAARPALARPSKLTRGRVRVLTAVPICDGHDSAIITINLELVRHGIEVIYLGFNRSARDIARAAIQEDVQAVGISSYNGGHVEFFTEVLSLLKKQGAGDIRVFGGGGGTITPEDAQLLKQRGVDELFFAGTPLEAIVEFVQRSYGRLREKIKPLINTDKHGFGDHQIAKLLSSSKARPRLSIFNSQPSTVTIGITGPGGAGKSTLIDELVLRFLNLSGRKDPSPLNKGRGRRVGLSKRLAILSHDPSLVGKGAMLGDRATMLYAQDDRVFMRSIGTEGKAGGLASATRNYLRILQRAGFDRILVESAGIGQEDMPFAGKLVDKQILVMSPEYGSRLQLQKIMMLETADVVVVNKADRPGARTALAEIEQRLALNGRGQKLIATVAKRHGDAGVDQLFREILP